MVRLIAVGGIKVEKGSCTVGFRVWPKFTLDGIYRSDLATGGKEITHDVMYCLLDSAVEITEFSRNDPNGQNRVAELNMGNGMLIDMWEVQR